MASELLRTIAARNYPAVASAGHITLPVGDASIEAEVTVGARTEIAIACPGLAELELTIRPGRTIGPRVTIADHWFEAAFDVTSNDPELARIWLDAEARAAVARGQGRPTVGEPVGLDYAFTIGDGRVLASAPAPEPNAQHLERAILAAATLALRPRGIARGLRHLARHVGAVATGERWDLEGGFALVTERLRAQVWIDHVRRLPDEPRAAARLRTRVRARGRAAGGGTDAFVVLPRSSRLSPPAVPQEIAPRLVPVILAGKLGDRWAARATAPAQLARQLEDAAARLLSEAAPDAILGIGAEVALLYEGMDTAPWRIGPGIELAASLVTLDRAVAGPYR